MIKIILFDYDGVLEDNYEAHLAFSMQKYRDLTREEHRQLFEQNIHLGLEALKGRDTDFDFRGHFHEVRERAVMPSEMKQVLQKLSHSFQLGIVTSAREGSILASLERNGVASYFSFVYGYETGVLKTDKMRKILSEFDLDPSECLFVTDTLGDIREAKEAGIQSIGLDSGYHERERLAKGNPLRIISTLSELFDALEDMK